MDLIASNAFINQDTELINCSVSGIGSYWLSLFLLAVIAVVKQDE